MEFVILFSTHWIMLLARTHPAVVTSAMRKKSTTILVYIGMSHILRTHCITMLALHTMILMMTTMSGAGLDADEGYRPPVTSAHKPADPLRSELLRCNELGQPALDNPACRAAWAENRRVDIVYAGE